MEEERLISTVKRDLPLHKKGTGLRKKYVNIGFISLIPIPRIISIFMLLLCNMYKDM